MQRTVPHRFLIGRCIRSPAKMVCPEKAITSNCWGRTGQFGPHTSDQSRSHSNHSAASTRARAPNRSGQVASNAPHVARYSPHRPSAQVNSASTTSSASMEFRHGAQTRRPIQPVCTQFVVVVPYRTVRPYLVTIWSNFSKRIKEMNLELTEEHIAVRTPPATSPKTYSNPRSSTETTSSGFDRRIMNRAAWVHGHDGG